jgi:hypothetical protein
MESSVRFYTDADTAAQKGQRRFGIFDLLVKQVRAKEDDVGI